MQLIFVRKSDCLGCAVGLPCLFDLTCFFLSSHLSLKHVHIYVYIHVHTCACSNIIIIHTTKLHIPWFTKYGPTVAMCIPLAVGVWCVCTAVYCYMCGVYVLLYTAMCGVYVLLYTAICMYWYIR